MPPPSMSRLRTDDMLSMASSSSTVTAPSVSLTSTTRSRMRILAVSTILARADPIAASASWLGTTMTRYSTRSVLISSLPPRRFGSSVMAGTAPPSGLCHLIVGQSRVVPHHPRACGPRFFVPEARRLDTVVRLSLERCEGGPAGRQHAGLSTQPASAMTTGASGQFEARNYPEWGGPALPSPLVVSRPLSSLVLPAQARPFWSPSPGPF